MALKLSGVTLGNLTGGPSSLSLADLSDVSIVSPATGEYLRYNGTLSEWQNVTLDSDVYDFLDTNLLESDGVTLTAISGPNTVTIGLGNITPDSVAASGTVTGSNLSGTNTGDQTITLTGDVTGSGTGSFAATLATVNGSPQTNTFRRITVNGKGLVTATSSVTSGDITTALGFTPLDKGGDTMEGPLILDADPTTALGAATKQYVDNTASGIVAKPAVYAATTAPLTATYNNGSSGVGATLTATTNGAWPGVDGVTTGWSLTDGVLIKNQTNAAQNGRYYVSDLGSGSTPWVLTRCTYCDTADEIPGAYTFVNAGTQAGTGWVQVVDNPSTFVVGTDPINVYQFSGSGTITDGTGIDVTGNVVSLATGNTLSLFNLSTNGILVRSGTATISSREITVAGNGLSVDNGTGVSGNPEIQSNATSANTASTIVFRDSNGSFSANAVNATSLNATGNVTASGNINLSTTGDQRVQITGTTDGADTGRLILSSTGSVLTSRGAYIILSGNESSTTGNVSIQAGDVGVINLGGGVGGTFVNGSGGLTVTNGIITGNGSGLTNLNATNLSTGTISDSRLSSNVALKNASNTFTQQQFISSTTAGSNTEVLRLNPTDYGTDKPGFFIKTGANATTWQIGLWDGTDSNGTINFGVSDVGFAGNIDVTGNAIVDGNLVGQNFAQMYRGFVGGYGADGSGTGTDWGGNIWGMGTSFDGSGVGTSFSTSGMYGLAFLRASHANSNASVGEGLYVFSNGSLNGGIGTAGIYTAGAFTGRLVAPAGTVGVPGVSIGDNDTGLFAPSAGQIAITTNSSEALRIVGNNLIVGHSSALSTRIASTVVTPTIQSPGTSANSSSSLYARFSNTTGGPFLHLAKSRGASTGTQVAVQAGDDLGAISFAGSDGTQFTEAARIRAKSTTLATTDTISGSIEFLTTQAGFGPQIEMTIGPDGQVTMVGNIASTSPTTGTLVVTGGVGISEQLHVASQSSFGGTMRVGTTAGHGYLNLATGLAGQSGYVAFHSHTSGTRQGYIGFSTTNAAVDTGTIPYIAGTHSFSGAITSNSTISATNNITINRGANPGYFVLNRDAGNEGGLLVRTGGNNRWQVGASSETESGSNSGSNFRISRYSDAGTLIDQPISIDRATGAVLMSTISMTGFAFPRIDLLSSGIGRQTIDDTIGSGITLTAAGMNNTTASFAPSIKWGSTDPEFTTANPKIMAAISAVARQAYSSDTSGGMDLVFYATPSAPGAGPTGIMVESMRITTAQVTAPAFNATSTKRVKKAVKNLSKKYLEKFNDLKPREYDRRDVTKHEFGFIAEEMALVYPEVVGLDDSGKPSGIDYGKLSTILTAKVQEQQKTIDKLQDQIYKIMRLLKGTI